MTDAATTPAALPLKSHIEVMGTVVSFDVRPGTARRQELVLAVARAGDALRRADAVFSTWKPNSPVSRLRRGEVGLGEVPPVVAEVLELCWQARRASGGWFDPWGAPGGVDPTGLVKGWAAEVALAAIMEVPGVGGALVNAGGDIACRGRPAPGRGWRIAVRSPESPTRLVATVDGMAAVATSGTYERGPHLYPPAGRGADGAVASATVAGPELWLADALATGLAVAGEAALGAIDALVNDGYEAVVVRPDGTLRRSTYSRAVQAAA